MTERRVDDDTLLQKPQPFRKFIPSLITLAGLCFGLSAIRFAMIDRWEICVSFIFAAALIDGLDGRAARLLRATSTFGAQLDSLSDFVCFGITPVIILYMWQLEDIQRFGWAVVLFHAVCCALRLARFNTATVEDSQKPWEKNFFIGIPSPAGGLLALLPVVLFIEPDFAYTMPAWMTALYMLTISSLMVSRIPTFAMKNIRVPVKYIIPVMLLSTMAVVFGIIEPWKMLIFAGIIYLITIPFSYLSHRKLTAKHQSE